MDHPVCQCSTSLFPPDLRRDGDHGDAGVAPPPLSRRLAVPATPPRLGRLPQELLGVVDGDGEGDAGGDLYVGLPTIMDLVD